jgi:two-component system response regulator AtoC
MRPVELIIRELAQSDVPVLLVAERGAGKHATAQRIHEMSRRHAQPFRALRCSTLRPGDLDPATENGTAISGGTIFLEEVSELGPDSQKYLQKLLSADGNFDRAAGNPRFICGSSCDLEAEVKAGRLREDLYYRISGVCLRLPPLRQRREDIPGLTRHFLSRYAQQYYRAVPELSAETQRLFQEYSWPGNLKELEDAARILVALGDENLAMGGLSALLHRDFSEGNRAVSLKAASRAASLEAEKSLILKALTRTRWNRRRAAAELQISYKALLYKLKQIRCESY